MKLVIIQDINNIYDYDNIEEHSTHVIQLSNKLSFRIISDKLFHTKEEAIEAIEIFNDENYTNEIAVVKLVLNEFIFISNKEEDVKKRFNLISKKIGLEHNSRFDINEETFFTQDSEFMRNIVTRLKNQKDHLKTCKKCDSSLNIKYIKTTFCPMCGNKTFLTTSKDIVDARKIKNKLIKINKQIKDIILKRETITNKKIIEARRVGNTKKKEKYMNYVYIGRNNDV